MDDDDDEEDEEEDDDDVAGGSSGRRRVPPPRRAVRVTDYAAFGGLRAASLASTAEMLRTAGQAQRWKLSFYGADALCAAVGVLLHTYCRGEWRLWGEGRWGAAGSPCLPSLHPPAPLACWDARRYPRRGLFAPAATASDGDPGRGRPRSLRRRSRR